MSSLSSFLPTRAGASADDNPAADPAGSPAAVDRGPAATPVYRLTETDEASGLSIELPGVTGETLERSVDHERVHLVGRRAWARPVAWTELHRGTPAAVELVLAHGRVIDAEKVTAELRDDVLQLALPKSEVLRPREISVG